ncbi:hypothetical protein L916_09710, partial [Phytophthora nicotianae]
MIYLATNNLVKQEQKNEERLQNQSKEAHRDAIQQERRLEDLRLVIGQKQQADATRKILKDERTAQFQDDQAARSVRDHEDDRFRVVAQRALEEARERGLTNVFPIQKR